MSMIALGMPEGGEGFFLPLLIVAGCGVIGLFVFGGYALLFSNVRMAKLYFGAARPINLLIAALFCAAGVSLLYRSIV